MSRALAAVNSKTFLVRSWTSTAELADKTRAYIPRCENPVVAGIVR